MWDLYIVLDDVEWRRKARMTICRYGYREQRKNHCGKLPNDFVWELLYCCYFLLSSMWHYTLVFVLAMLVFLHWTSRSL